MPHRKSFEIKGLKARSTFADSRRPVLSHHFKRISRRAEKYTDSATEENLHNLRIALRRFRYLLEVYSPFIKGARFKTVYGMAVELQNLLGERRDLDVMQLKLKNMFDTAKSPLPASVITELETARAHADQQIAEMLPKFITDRQIHKLIGK